MVRIEYLEEKDIEKVIEWNKDKTADFLLQWSGPQYQHPLTKEQIQQRQYCFHAGTIGIIRYKKDLNEDIPQGNYDIAIS